MTCRFDAAKILFGNLRPFRQNFGDSLIEFVNFTEQFIVLSF